MILMFNQKLLIFNSNSSITSEGEHLCSSYSDRRHLELGGEVPVFPALLSWEVPRLLPPRDYLINR